MDIIIIPLLRLFQMVLGIYKFFLISFIIVGWLEFFNIINQHNHVVCKIQHFLYAVTQPALQPLRRFIPSLGGIDLSAIVMFLLIYYLENLIGYIFIRFNVS
jgi:YggT family protein